MMAIPPPTLPHGFRNGLFTTTQLISCVHSFSTVLDKSGQTDVIFLNFRKAFDSIPHFKLIHKLNLIGFPSAIVKWVESYLSSRTQFVDINGVYSNPLPVNSGVPQGSVLGPLLFLIYNNDITKCAKQGVEIRLFADDCLLFRSINSLNDQITLHQSVEAITTWCDRWGINVNPDKTIEIVHVSRLKPFVRRTTP